MLSLFEGSNEKVDACVIQLTGKIGNGSFRAVGSFHKLGVVHCRRHAVALQLSGSWDGKDGGGNGKLLTDYIIIMRSRE